MRGVASSTSNSLAAIVKGTLLASHVVVLAASPVLFIYAASISTYPIPLDHLVRPLAIAGTLALLLTLTVATWTRNLQQSATIVSMFCLGTLTFLFTSTAGDAFWIRAGWPLWLLAGLHVVAGSALAGMALECDRATQLVVGLRIGAVALCAIVAVQTLLATGRPQAWRAATDTIQAAGRITVPAGGPRPDIVHLVFDGLGSPEVLRDLYGLETSGVVATLEASGFVVADQAHSNYPYTYSSLASMLNASYLDPLKRFEELQDRRPLAHLIDSSVVIGALKAAGYAITLIGSNYGAMDRHPLADRCVCDAVGLSELEAAAYRLTPLRLWTLDWLTYSPARQKIRTQLAAVDEIPATGPPQYVLAHVMLPHPPFAFDEHGGPAPPPRPLFGIQDATGFPGTADEYWTGYRAQARYALDTIVRLAQRLRARPRPTVVIVTGDHGPATGFNPDDAATANLQERFGAFSAIAMPDHGNPPQGRSLVNLYRYVFRHALEAKVDDLQDLTIYSPFTRPYRFTSVELRSNSGPHEAP